ncbi:MAG: sigma-54-dependent Fis family transcriptional regulator [Desulfobacteraceae bacterium]|nr:MAG: sigma-54-dependent Fis family transcriptional regulator [Desulfobacteraceae bacterium]
MISLPKTFTPLLAVDDDTGLLLSVKASLMSAGMPEPALASDSREVIDLIKKYPFQLVLIDLIMPHIDGIALLEMIKNEAPHVECIIITAIDDVSTAVQSMKFGAYDYLIKPLQTEKLFISIKNALEKYELRQNLNLFEQSHTLSSLKHPEAFKDMVAQDEAMALILHQAETYGYNDYNLMITGETGVGKEVLAQAVHRLSVRASGPFIAVSMPSLSKTLFEDEVFGHSKGAYTGANSEKKGFFEEAQGGTLFLDEIAEMPMEMQAKLLRVIQERELYRVGSTQARAIDVRIISATNRDIREEVEKGNFRRDLMYRLNVCHIHIPPLRQRPKDILPLALHFLNIHSRQTGKAIHSISPEASLVLSRYPFPGNVRELENIIASSVLDENGKSLSLSSIKSLQNHPAPSDIPCSETLLPLSELEKNHIHRVLEFTGGNRTHAAAILEISSRTLQRKLKLYET